MTKELSLFSLAMVMLVVAAGFCLADQGIADQADSLLTSSANDGYSGAEVIPSSGPFPYLTTVVDVTNATSAGDPSTPSCGYPWSISRSIWFSFTSAVSGSYTISTGDTASTGTTLGR